MVWPTLGSRMAKEYNRTEAKRVVRVTALCASQYFDTDGCFLQEGHLTHKKLSYSKQLGFSFGTCGREGSSGGLFNPGPLGRMAIK